MQLHLSKWHVVITRLVTSHNNLGATEELLKGVQARPVSWHSGGLHPASVGPAPVPRRHASPCEGPGDKLGKEGGIWT